MKCTAGDQPSGPDPATPAQPPNDELSETQEDESLGNRVRALRRRQKLSLADLARLSGVSKGYLSQVERSLTVRPSAATIFAIAEALGTTVGELFEGKAPGVNRLPDGGQVPASLQEFALEVGLPPTDIDMLAQIRYRGVQPRDKEDWRYLYESIRRTIRYGRRPSTG